jgi:hypothetical protein
MKKINVLIIGNICSTGWNLKKGLEKHSFINNVHLIFKEHPTIDGVPTPKHKLLNPKQYDIVHYQYPFIKTHFQYYKYIRNCKKLVCHWRGTDLRLTSFKNPIKNLFYRCAQKTLQKHLFKKADFHFYSTYDLAWWLRNIPSNKKSHLFSLIDTNTFKDYKLPNRKGIIHLKKGAKGFGKQKIKHKDMPKILNKYKFAEITPAEGLDPHTIQVSTMECLACGLKVKYHEEKNRFWVQKNASIPVVTNKVIKIYEKLLL